MYNAQGQGTMYSVQCWGDNQRVGCAVARFIWGWRVHLRQCGGSDMGDNGDWGRFPLWASTSPCAKYFCNSISPSTFHNSTSTSTSHNSASPSTSHNSASPSTSHNSTSPCVKFCHNSTSPSTSTVLLPQSPYGILAIWILREKYAQCDTFMSPCQVASEGAPYMPGCKWRGTTCPTCTTWAVTKPGFGFGLWKLLWAPEVMTEKICHFRHYHLYFDGFQTWVSLTR